MKILFVLNNTFKPTSGGIQRTTWLLGEYFQSQNHQVYFFTFKKSDHAKDCPGHLEAVEEDCMMTNQVNNEHFKTFMELTQPHIVINQIPTVLSLGEQINDLKGELGFKIFSCIHGSLFNFKDNLPLMLKDVLPAWQFNTINNNIGFRIIKTYHKYSFGQKLKIVLNQCDKFVLLAPSYIQELKYFVANYPTNKVEVIPNPVYLQDVDLSKKEKVILYVGRLDIGQKRSDLLVDIWKNSFKKLEDWKLIILGDGSYKKIMQQRIKDENILGIELKGRVKPEEYYKIASIFVMTSAYEGFPNVLLEAQSYGCASVVFNSYSALSYITNKEDNTIRVYPYNVEAFSNKITELCKNSEMLKHMQQFASQNSQRFTLDSVGEQWEQLIKLVTLSKT